MRIRQRILTALPVLVASLGIALAQGTSHPVRVLPRESDATGPTGGGSPELSYLLDRVTIGPPVTPPGMRQVQVYPLIVRRGTTPSDKDLFIDPGYLTLDEAMREGLVHVSEKRAAIVPGLEVDNTGDRPVLILAGEILVGGKQNRILQSDVLLPARSGPRDVSAFCVEHGRWTQGASEFRQAGAMAPAPVRRSAASKSAEAQSDVWNSIATLGRSAGVGADSPTQSLHDVLEDPKVVAGTSLRAKELRDRLPDGTVGMIAVANGSIYAVDLFGSTQLFSKYVDKLTRAAIVGAPEPLYYKGIGDPGIERFLQAARDAVASYAGSAGLGTRVEIDGSGVHGEALVVQRRIVHTALFLW